MTIFKTPELYPDEFTPFLTHFYEFDKVFIAFSPFIQLKKDNFIKSNFMEISYQKAVQDVPILEKISPEGATIFGTNETYPTDQEIKEHGKTYYWQSVLNACPIANLRDLTVALASSTSKLRHELKRDDLAEILENFVQTHDLWYPIDSRFNYFSRKAIYNFLKITYNRLVNAETEFYDEKLLLNLNLISEDEFIEKIENFTYLYPWSEKDFLFSVGHERDFFLIAIKTDKIKATDIEKLFEGFWAEANHNNLWCWTKAEIDALPN